MFILLRLLLILLGKSLASFTFQKTDLDYYKMRQKIFDIYVPLASSYLDKPEADVSALRL